MIDRAIVQAQRDELRARIDRARLAYADLEVERDRVLARLAELTRHLDGMAGGLVAYDALLATEDVPVTNGQAPTRRKGKLV